MMKAHSIARYILAFANECGELLTNFKLNTLVYYAQAWHLALVGKPFFDDPIEAWVHGPIVLDVYIEYRHYGHHPILEDTGDINAHRAQFSPEQQHVLDEVIDVYFVKSAYELEHLTHIEDPWLLAREGLPPDAASHNVIDRDAMKQYYGAMVVEA